jgi:hypothetical protein
MDIIKACNNLLQFITILYTSSHLHYYHEEILANVEWFCIAFVLSLELLSLTIITISFLVIFINFRRSWDSSD